MQAAAKRKDHDTLVDHGTYDAVPRGAVSGLSFVPLDPITIKGKAEPIQIYAPLSISSNLIYALAAFQGTEEVRRPPRRAHGRLARRAEPTLRVSASTRAPSLARAP